MIGQTIGDYRITDKLGQGGFGVVYKAVELSLDRVVALKTMDEVLARDVKFRDRFFAEARVQARLVHPNVVTIYRFFEHDGQYFIAMEYLEGMLLPDGSRVAGLAELIRRGPVPEEKLLPLFRPVLDAVGYAHHHGILHRDIKPLNILFAESGVLKVGDFGIAKMVGGDTSVSMSGTRVGTPAYMSPEQVFDKRLTRATDIYSLGCTLYESATGKLSFKESDTSSLLEAHVTEPPVPPRQVNPGISESLERVILKALEKKPGDRFQGCEEFAEALAGVGAASQPRLAASNGLKTHPEPDSDVSHLPSRVLPPVPEAGGLKTKPERYNGIDAGYEGRRGTAHKVGLIRKVVAVIFLTLAASCVPPLVAMLLTLANGLLRRG